MTSLNLVHLHLLLNHIPTIGTVAALAFLLLALVRRHEGLTYAGLEVLFVVAVLTLPVYTTGGAAMIHLKKVPEASDYAIRVHQDAALAGFTVTEFAGFVAWLALWKSRRQGRVARGLVTATTVLTIVAVALMGRAANLGGEIRHPEILTAPAAAAAATDPTEFVAGAIANVMVNSRWVWPAAESIHFLGLSLSFGVLLAVNLRMLGVMKRVKFAHVHRLLPWGMLGFGANLITGMLFFVGQPGQYVDSPPFLWKVLFLVIAGANFLYLTVIKEAWADGFDSSLTAKAMAATSIAAWLAVLYAGRMLPFLGSAF